MMTQAPSPPQTEFSIHPATTLGHISLTVASLENQMVFYQQVLGFRLHWRDASQNAVVLTTLPQPD